MINPMKEQTEIRKKLHAATLDAPKTSGVYLWKDEAGVILYVGKAKSLKNRLSSYFTSHRDIKTRILVSRASSIEYITTENEYEALLLENTLIKKHKPRYNINLKDGKPIRSSRLPARLSPHLPDEADSKRRRAVFRPFPDVNAIDDFLDFVKRNYKMRQCRVLKNALSPASTIISDGAAPLLRKIDKEGYQAEMEEILLLEGDPADTVPKLERMMKDAAKISSSKKASA